MMTSADIVVIIAVSGLLAIFTVLRPRASLLCFLVVVPAPLMPEWLGFDPRLYWAFCLAACAIYRAFVDWDMRLPKEAVRAWLVFVAFAGIVLWLNRSGLSSEDFEGANSFFRYFLAGSLAFLVLRQVLSGPLEIAWATRAFGYSVLLVSLDGIWEAVQSYVTAGEGRIVGLFGNPNYLAAFLALSVTLLINVRKQSQKPERRLFGVCIVIASVCCLLTFSRAGITALVVGASLTWLLRPGAKLKARRLALAVFPPMLTVILLTTSQLMSVRYRVTYSDAPESTGIAAANQSVEDLSRFEAALYALNLFADHPILGTGTGTFAARNYQATGNYVATHNTYLEILTGVGLVGFLLLSRLGWKLWQALNSAQQRALSPTIGVFLVIGLTVDLLQSLECFAVAALAYAFATEVLQSQVPYEMRVQLV